MTPAQEAIKEMLEKGLEKIRKHGWCQGAYTNSVGAHCLVGAICERTHSIAFDGARNILFQVLGKEHYSPTVCLVLWNDTPGRTQKEVEDLYEKAIAKLP